MKGPGLRTRYDVRRLWRCPETGRTLKATGSVTQMRSPFTRQERFMEFVEVVKTPRRQMPLDEILEHMQIAPEPEVASSEPATKSASESTTLQETETEQLSSPPAIETAEVVESEFGSGVETGVEPVAAAEEVEEVAPGIESVSDTVVDSETDSGGRIAKQNSTGNKPADRGPADDGSPVGGTDA